MKFPTTSSRRRAEKLTASRQRWCAALLLLFAAAMAGRACGQAAGPAQSSEHGLPDAPGAMLAGEAAAETRLAIEADAADADGSVSGTVVDADGDAIPGAVVTLTPAGNAGPARHVVADGQGWFQFRHVPGGSWTLSVSSGGFLPSVQTLALGADEQRSTADVVLVASASDEVDVRLSVYDLAEEEVRVEEHQRLGGVLPNFYVTYNWHAAPLAQRQKFRLALRSIVDPTNFAMAGIFAGVEQATDAFPGYGQGALGFGKRYGAALADGTIGTMLGGAVLPALFRQDPRYFYKGSGSVISRALYALSTAVICRGDNGRWQPNYSSVLGDIGAGAASNLYYPARQRNDAVLTIEQGLVNAASDGVSNLLQEFVFRHLTPGARDGGREAGKP